MRVISVHELAHTDVNFGSLEFFPAAWAQRKRFLEYAKKERDTAALLLICTDIHAVYYTEGGGEMHAGKGDFVYIPRGVRYRAYFDGGKPETPIDSYTVNFRLFAADGEELSLSDSITVLTCDRTGALSLAMEALGRAVHSRTGGAPDEQSDLLAVKSAFFSLLSQMTAAVKGETDGYPIRRGIEAFCREWNKNEKVETYAALCSVSTGYFHRLFREWAGVTPAEYRNRLRVSNAEAMLRNTDMAVAEIAHAVGVEDSFYFCRLFKKRTGLSPMEFRRTAKGSERQNSD